MSMHYICLYLFCVYLGVSVVEVNASVLCEHGCMVVIDSVYLDCSVYHFCKVL